MWNLKGTAGIESVLLEEMRAFLQSDKRREMLEGERYYQGKHDILKRRKTVVGPGGVEEECSHLLNSRVVDNQYARVVDQKVSYLLGKPLTLETEREECLDELYTLFGPEFRRTLRLVGEDALNCGIGWLHPCYDKRGQLRFRRMKPWEIVPIWADDAHNELEAALRVYEQPRGELDAVPMTILELFTAEGMYRFATDMQELRPEEGFHPYFACRCDGKLVDGVWMGVPLIPFRAGFREISLLRQVKGLQDGINTLLSDFQDRMGEDTHHTVLVIRNFDGEDLGEFRRNLAAFGAVKVRSDGGDGGGVDTLSVTVDAQNFESVLGLLKRALIENAKGFDVRDLSLAASPNQMAIQSMYADMDLDAAVMELEFMAAFRELMGFVCMHLEQMGLPGVLPHEVSLLLHRDMLINESETIENCIRSRELLSAETVLQRHPWVCDVEKEVRRLKEV